MDEGIEPYQLIRPAATGSLIAQRMIADEAIRRVNEGECDAVSGLVEGLIFARLAASHGDQSDQVRLLTMLSALGPICPTKDCSDLIGGEAMAIASRLADNGEEIAATLLTGIAEGLSPEAVAYSKVFHQRMQEAEHTA